MKFRNVTHSFALPLLVFSLVADARLNVTKCLLPTADGYGLCIPVDECFPAVEVLLRRKKGLQPTACAFDRKEQKAYVCCRVSAVKCSQYKKDVKTIVDNYKPTPVISPLRPWFVSDGTTTERPVAQRGDQKRCPGEPELTGLIINGVKARRDQFPHMVALGVFEQNAGALRFPCGGSLISDRWVLTAAHCFKEDLNFVRIHDEVQLEFNVFDPSRDFYIAKKVIHEQYAKKFSNYYDIALAKLYDGWNVPVVFSTRIYPGCLNQFPASNVKGPADVIGWGVTEYLGEKSRDLLYASIPVVDDAECSGMINNSFLLRRKFSRGAGNGIICAFDPKNRSDACQGDSGGPMCVRDRETCVYDVIGIVSQGVGCGSRLFPGIYTDVYYHLSWIEQHVWPVDEVITDLA